MQSITAKDAKNNFGHLIDQARHEPVTITRHGRGVAVVMAAEEYQKLMSQQLKSSLLNIETLFPTGHLISEHREAGIPMYFRDEDTPEGFLKCLLPDGSERLVAQGKKVDWPKDEA